MKRRKFITLLGGAAAWPIAAQAQQRTLPLIGYLDSFGPEVSGLRLAAFREGLREAGSGSGFGLISCSSA